MTGEIQIDEAKTKGSTGQGRELLIFVVDDERVVAMTLGMILTRMGFLVRSFIDPVEALRAAESGVPDILLADVVMPEMNGIELAGRLGDYRLIARCCCSLAR